MSFAGAAAIEGSLEIAGARGGDLTTAIYTRLFAEFPETEALFVMDRDGQVRGAMLAHVFETIFDFIGERRYAHRFIGAEIVTHDGYGVDSGAFAAFFGVVRDEVRSACGSAWTDAMEEAWQGLLSDFETYTARPVS
ncbi:MAG: globin [Hyphomonadaceae bacterium]|nr:globin [Hyphomonadaceae bacterium]